MEFREIFPRVYRIKDRLATKNLIKDSPVYGERIIEHNGEEYRIWDPFRSKLAAAILKGLKTLPIKPGSEVLYLGASTGTTPSHVSDIVGKEGMVYCIEFSPKMITKLIRVAELRENMIPILADARKPESYEDIEGADVLYMDVAQKDQDEILIKNARKFLKPGAHALVAVKSQSIDVVRSPTETFRIFKNKIKRYFDILEEYRLEPYDKDHLFLLLKFLNNP